MKRIILLILLLIVLISIFFIGCSIPSGSSGNSNSSNDDDDDDSSTYVPGTTLPSSITNSTPITLPADVSASKIIGGAISLISTFPLSIDLTNNTSTTYNYTFKAGSNFWANTGESQNLILVWDVTITINPGNNSTIILPTFCLNSDLHAPEVNDYFILGTVYTGDCMGVIINILSTKNPSTFDIADILIIQNAIWECMINGSLDPTTISNLNAL